MNQLVLPVQGVTTCAGGLFVRLAIQWAASSDRTRKLRVLNFRHRNRPSRIAFNTHRFGMPTSRASWRGVNKLILVALIGRRILMVS
jgi:hypothetical protein